MGSGNTATVEDAIASSQKPRFGLPARVLRLLMIPAALVLIVVSTCMAVRLADQNLRRNLLQQARLVAQAIDMKHVQVLSGTKADLVSPDYQRLKEQLGSIRSANAQCRFLYLLGRQPDGKIVFFVDSEPSNSKDYSPPGQLFEEATADLLGMFETKVPFVEGPVTDSWGIWVSALVPLIDPKTGALVAVLGMDIDAHLWTWDVAARVALPVGLLLVILIGMTSAYLATRPVGRDRTGRHRDFEPKPVLRRLMPPLAAMVILLLTGAGVGLYWQHRQQMARDIAAVTADVSNDLRVALNQQASELTVAAQTIAADTAGRKALRASDGSRLLALWQPVFETLRREKHISHFYILDTRRVCLLRLHKPDKKGDRIERFTALEAERTGKSATGIELGAMGTFTLRTILPVCEDGALVGYVELGKEIEDTLQEMHPRHGVQIAVSIRKEHLNQQTWEEGMRMLGRDSDWSRLPRSVLIYASQGRLPDVFAPMADHDQTGRHTRGDPDRQLAFAGRDWRVSAIPLKDVSGQEVGDVLVMCDISDGQVAFARLVILGGTVGGVLLALLLGFVYVLLRQTDRLIRSQERELRESEESYRNQFANNSAVMLLIDPSDGTITDANTAALNFYGYPRERLLTMRITDINTLPMAEALQTMAAVHENFGQRLQVQHRLADGSVRQVETSLSRIQFGGRTVLHAIIQDITEQKRAEEQLQKIDKLQSVGMLAGGIAHDFNNILLGLFGNISIAMDDLPKEHPSYAPLAEAEKSMARAVRLTKQLLTFAKGGDPVKENVSLGAMVEEVARFDLTGSNVSLVYHHDADLWPVDADRGQIQQVVSNLVINARQAMPNGGHLTISLENTHLPADAVPTLKQGRHVKVVVQDEGDGINPKVIGQIFDPYFSTKQTGSGLGLATVWSIINKHGGHIGVESELGKGTTFTFYLPASSSLLSAEEETPSAEIPSPARAAKILVMDDEETVSKLVARMLAPCGYTVATAPDGQEAIALYRQALEAGAPFDLVIMDLTIPGGSGGKEVIQDLLALDPNVRAIVSSGYADDPIMANPSKYGFKDTAAKPYTARALREAVARVLA